MQLAGRQLSQPDLRDVSLGLPRSCVQGLDLSMHQLSGGGANAGLIDMMNALPRSRVGDLSLKWCGLGSSEADALCRSASKGARFTSLNLRGNDFGPADAGDIGRSLVKSGQGPMNLSLASNAIGDDGVRQLCDSGAFGAQSGCVRHADLSDCAISGEGLKALSPFMHDSCLRSLDLRNTLLNDDDIDRLVHELRHSKLGALDLRGLPLTPQARSKLDSLKASNASLSLLY